MNTEISPNLKQNGIKKITLLFVICVLLILPLVYRNFYYDILEVKYYAYCAFSFAMYLAIIVYTAVRHKNMGKPIAAMRNGMDMPQVFMFLFLVLAAISTFQSDYFYESFWGNEGRYTGLFLLLIYGINFYIIIYFFNLKKIVLDVFLFSGLIVCLLGILDYFGIDPLGFKTSMRPGQIKLFTSTLGNINTHTAFVAMVLAVAAALFTKETSWKRSCWYFISVIISSFSLVMGCSDNAYLALAALFGILPLFLFRSKKGVLRYFVTLSSFFTVIYCIDWVNTVFSDYVRGLDSIFNIIVANQWLILFVLGLWGLTGILFYMFRRNKDDRLNNRVLYAWIGMLALILMGILFALYDVNVGMNVERYGKLGTYLKFDDSWGTNRGLVWRLTIENYNDLPLIHKIFGYGPETFGILTVKNNYKEMMDFTGSIFDNAHNEYLQMLITVGPLALISYLLIFITAGFQMVKRGFDNPCVVAVFMAVLCYSAQAMVNINLPIAAPIMLTLFPMGLAGVRNDSVSSN